MYEPNKATRRRDWGSRTYNQSLARPRGTHLRTHLCIMCQRSQWTEPPATTPTAVQKHRLKRHQQHRQEGNEQHPRTRSGHTRLPTRIYGAHLVSSTHQRNRPREWDGIRANAITYVLSTFKLPSRITSCSNCSSPAQYRRGATTANNPHEISTVDSRRRNVT